MSNIPVSVVTGANGFVGSHLVDYLLKSGNKVKCIVRKSSNIRWLEDKDVEIIRSGLFDLEALKSALTGADYLFHVAGVVKSKYEEGYYKGNVETTKNLLDTIIKNKLNIKRVTIISSQTACGPSVNGNPCNETTTPNPITTYGRSKLAQEKLAGEYADKIPITIIRPPAIYGERDTEIFLFFKTFNSGLMTKIGFNNKLVSIINVKDLVKGIYQASQSEKANGETYFISSKKYYNWDEIGDATQLATGKNALRLSIPHIIVYLIAAIAQFISIFQKSAATFNLEKARDFVQHYWICDISKAQKDFGFEPEIELTAGIKETIEWYKKHKWM